MNKRLEFHISYACVNNCSFCSEHDRMERFKKNPVLFGEIRRELIKKRKEGFNFVNFTGGEPTIHPDFLEILQFTKKLGYKIYVGTNGAMLAKKGFCHRALPFLDEISLSVHGHTAQLHDALVGRRGAFRDIVTASDNIDDAGFKNKFANVVAVRGNFKKLTDILEFLADRGFTQVLFSNLAPEGMGLRRFRELSVRLEEWQKKVPQLAAIAERYGMKIRFFGLPICALGEHAFLSNDLFWDARVTTERDERSGKITFIDVDGNIPDRNRVKTDACRVCNRARICFGVFDEYMKNFGADELKPF